MTRQGCFSGEVGAHLTADQRAHPPPASRVGRRRRTSAISADAAIRNRLTALSTGLAPSRILPYIMTVSGGAEPTSIHLVLEFLNDIQDEIAAGPTSARPR